MKIRSLLVMLSLLGAPAPLVAQRPAPPAEEVEPGGRGPVEMLLREREQLGLTQEQVRSLEAIRARMEERNRPLVARLLEMRRRVRAEFPRRPAEMAPAERRRFERRVNEARPLLRQIRENNRAAMREVGEVLTPEQKDRVREMIRERRDRVGPRGGRARRAYGF